ncbi:MAG TPA: carboxypeptidase regulatory-like domain-containing protein [Candidatus Thermoplasmatota archaeon]|nr:carboxypeptidase regulatory-like domain-containing protein [Candidatus Thermoplasmatota archaeon]
MVKLQLAALVAVSLVLLSGCSSKATPQAATGVEQAAGDLTLKATATTGVIRGVVVDEAIRPIAGALVTATAQGHTYTTNSTTSGAFGFQGLAPGVYLVKAHKAGFRDTQTTTDVKAGESEPAIVKVALPVDTTFVRPYAVGVVFKGFIDCGITTPALGLAVCSVPNEATCGIDPAVPCSGNVTADNFNQFIPVDGGVPAWVQHELVWKPTQAAGDQFSLTARTATAEHFHSGSYDKNLPNQPRGKSPLLYTANASVIAKFDIGRNNTGLAPAVFPGGIEGTGDQVCPPATPATRSFCMFDTGVTLEQDFTLYTHIFYGFTPPEGYRFTTDGEPRPPQ